MASLAPSHDKKIGLFRILFLTIGRTSAPSPFNVRAKVSFPGQTATILSGETFNPTSTNKDCTMQANSVVALECDSPGVEDKSVAIKIRARGGKKEVCLLLKIFFSLFIISIFSSKMFNLDLAMFVHRAELSLETDESFSSRSLVETLFSLD